MASPYCWSCSAQLITQSLGLLGCLGPSNVSTLTSLLCQSMYCAKRLVNFTTPAMTKQCCFRIKLLRSWPLSWRRWIWRRVPLTLLLSGGRRWDRKQNSPFFISLFWWEITADAEAFSHVSSACCEVKGILQKEDYKGRLWSIPWQSTKSC